MVPRKERTMKIKINDTYTLEIPDDYQKIPLPFFNEWVTALESGNYEQGFGKLFPSHNTYCCLGVLSSVQGRYLWHEAINGCELSTTNPCFSVIKNEGTFPSNCFIIGSKYGNLRNLVTANDTARLSFKEIAFVIKHLWKP